jgi:murein DD-endopeptidase / murein LD-carboxypeptidase
MGIEVNGGAGPPPLGWSRVAPPASGRGDVALSLIGAPFRLHGRDPVTGLDCVGVAALVFGVRDVPRGYLVRTADGARVAAMIDDAGLRRVKRDLAAGDLVLLKSGPAQCHLVVMTEAGFVHADAGIGRVVETPGLPPWPVIAVWEA